MRHIYRESRPFMAEKPHCSHLWRGPVPVRGGQHAGNAHGEQWFARPVDISRGHQSHLGRCFADQHGIRPLGRQHERACRCLRVAYDRRDADQFRNRHGHLQASAHLANLDEHSQRPQGLESQRHFSRLLFPAESGGLDFLLPRNGRFGRADFRQQQCGVLPIPARLGCGGLRRGRARQH